MSDLTEEEKEEIQFHEYDPHKYTNSFDHRTSYQEVGHRTFDDVVYYLKTFHTSKSYRQIGEDLGFHFRTIFFWASGRRHPEPENLEKLEEYFDLDNLLSTYLAQDRRIRQLKEAKEQVQQTFPHPSEDAQAYAQISLDKLNTSIQLLVDELDGLFEQIKQKKQQQKAAENLEDL